MAYEVYLHHLVVALPLSLLLWLAGLLYRGLPLALLLLAPCVWLREDVLVSSLLFQDFVEALVVLLLALVLVLGLQNGASVADVACRLVVAAYRLLDLYPLLQLLGLVVRLPLWVSVGVLRFRLAFHLALLVTLVRDWCIHR